MKVFRLLPSTCKKSIYLANTFKPLSTQIQPWVEAENRLAKLKGELVLSDRSHIVEYAISLVQGYYRTTNKEGVTAESDLADHGLDSLDAVELCIKLEDELGYIIEAETMTKIKKVRHIIHFIEHLEAYKQEFKTLPQEKAHEFDNWDEWLPKGEKIKHKLFKHTKKEAEKNTHI
jgi:acyl carrier protein